MKGRATIAAVVVSGLGALTTGMASTVISTDGLAFRIPFDDAAGSTTAAAVPATYNGTVVNNSTGVNTFGVPGLANTAWFTDSDGAAWASMKGDYLDMPDNNVTRLVNAGGAGGEFTICGWLNYSDIVASGNPHLYFAGDAGTSGTLIDIWSGNGGQTPRIAFTMRLDAGVASLVLNPTWVTDRWYFYAATYEQGGTGLELYLADGTMGWPSRSLTTSGTGATFLPDASANVRIGRDSAPGAFDGKMDEFNLWFRALAEAELARLFQHHLEGYATDESIRGTTGVIATNGLVLHLPFDESPVHTPNTWYDDSGNFLRGTVTTGWAGSHYFGSNGVVNTSLFRDSDGGGWPWMLGDVVDLPENSGTTLVDGQAAGGFTICGWFKYVDTSSSGNPRLYHAISGNEGAEVRIMTGTDNGSGANANIEFVVGNGSSQDVRTINPPGNVWVEDRWYFFAARLDGTQTVLWLTHSESTWVSRQGSAGSLSGFDAAESAPVFIGRTDGTATALDSCIDEFSVWSRPLSAAEVETLFNANKAGTSLFYTPPPPVGTLFLVQ